MQDIPATQDTSPINIGHEDFLATHVDHFINLLKYPINISENLVRIECLLTLNTLQVLFNIYQRRVYRIYELKS